MAILLPIFLIVGLILLLFGLIGLKLYFLADIEDILYDGINATTSFFANLPNSTIGNIYFSAWIFVPFMIFIILMAIYLRNRDKSVGGICVLAFCVVTICLFYNPRPQGSWFYLLGNSRSTEVVMTLPDKALVYSNAESDSLNVEKTLTRHHPDFLGKRKFNSFSFLPANQPRASIRKNGRLLEVGDKTIAFITDEDDCDYPLPGNRADYAIITKRFGRGDVVTLRERLGIDTIILPKELHINHVRYLEDVLTENKTPFYNLRKTKLWRRYQAE